jgi:ribA/ribD-fused uncharacterized protein
MDTKAIHTFIDTAKKDKKTEFECSVLPGIIQTKDTADRMLEAIKTISLGPPTETTLLRVFYPDNIRVEVETPQQIQRVCSTSSFKGVPVLVQRKTPYQGVKNIDLPDIYSRFRLRLEENIRKDWEASPNDPRVSSIRLMNRKTFTSQDELFHIDFSMVKSRKDKKHSLRDVLKEQHIYELEIEFVNRATSMEPSTITESLLKIINTLLQAFQQSEFLLTPTDQERYIQEFRHSKLAFYNPVTLERRTLKKERPHNIWNDYTVTIKADGERFGLFVARDKKVLRINKQNKVVWTGLRTTDDAYIGDFVDGEYIPQKNLFCIFDIYRYRGKDLHSLPLMKGDESRLTYASKFAKDIESKFITESTTNPLRIETKLFLAGDGKVMEQCIKQLLETDYEYETDGLIFTPRLSPVAPKNVLKGATWTTVYKWKPPHQNSIDFLIKLSDDQTYDPVQDTMVKRGELYISRSSYDSILYPCETLTGEYVPKALPSDLQKLADSNNYIPSLFQPSNPRDPDAYKIMVPVDAKGLAHDSLGTRVEDNTIIECSYDTETQRWKVMRTRYDKTYEFRILNKTQYGNDRAVADNIWSSIHIPVTEDMIANFASIPIDDSQEDEVYYKEEINRKARILQPAYEFNNRVKDQLYSEVREGTTLLEFGVGQGGDLHRWKRTKVGKVVGIDPATRGLKEACKRYLDDKEKNATDYRPAVLFIEGTMLEPLFEQASPKYKILSGEEKATTKYLEQFEDLKKFNSSSSQFTIHYACESEESFRAFVRNVDTHTKETFFGTCLDGQTVYSLLMGKQTHIFTNGKDVGGEFTKEYDDKQTWVEEFGLPINVTLESFDKPAKEYIVPFGKVTEIFKEHGFDLKESHLFSELYSRQQKVLTPEQQSYAFLHRTFVFVRGEKPVPEAVPEPNDEVVPEPVPEKKTRKLKKADGAPGEKPVLFNQPGEDKGEFKTFSNQAEYPIQISDVRYPTVEHYYQAMKAKEFGDDELYEKIIKTPSGKAVKALGEKIKNFHKEIWDAKQLEVMMRGVKAKFVQHPELQKQLLETGQRQIGYADARDSYWGIGTSENTDKSTDPTKWKGQNHLGKIISNLRQDFLM